MAHDEQLWLTPRLQKAAALCNQTPAASDTPLWLGVDLGTCDVVSMVVDGNAQPVAVCLDWADVVRDGIVWDFFGGGTTGIAIVKQGKVTYSADEATGGHHISLTLAGNRRIPLEEAEQYKRSNAQEIWPVVKPVYEKMAEIVARHIEGQGIADLWLAGGSCMQPGVEALFRQRFPELQVHLPQHSLFMTPLAIANSGRAKAEGLYAS
ncbi:ethanolamine utilization protein EutJ [Salmonella enterica subsp. enterica]|nr:ethanolamine utilization protein EutJ [Salmonella enterica subsp. enterica]